MGTGILFGEIICDDAPESKKGRETYMAKYVGVSKSVIQRLPRYHRYLKDLLDRGVHRISSCELAQLMKLTASQIRQDLNCFGGFGQQGYGYNVDALYEEIGNILGLNRGLKAVMLGAGNLGMALINYINFNAKGFQLIGIFEANEALIGQTVHGLTIRSHTELEDFCKKHHPDVAILCLPREEVQAESERLVNCGVRGFWNFSHYDLFMDHKDKDIVVNNVHLGDSLMTLCYQVNEMDRT